MNEEMLRLDPKQIRVEEDGNRAHEDAGLLTSVETLGVTTSVQVYVDDDGSYVLVAGHRRLESAVHYNIATIPVNIVKKEDKDVIRAVENTDRKDEHPLDQAASIRTLQAKGYSNEAIATMKHMTKAEVIRMSRLNNLTPELTRDYREDKISLEAAMEYAVMDKDMQKKVKDKVYQGCRKEDIRRAYMDLQGIRLYNVTKEFLLSQPSCNDCNSNLTVEQADLFSGECGCCRDPHCYAQKLKSLMEIHKAEAIISRWDIDNKLLKKEVEKVGYKKLDYWQTSGSPTTGCTKYVEIAGEIRYLPKQNQKPQRTKEEKDLLKEYRTIYAKTAGLSKEYILECSKSYMDKSYRNMAFPDSNDMTLMAERILRDSSWLLASYLELKTDELQALITGMDNSQKIGLVLMQLHINRMETDHQDKKFLPEPDRDMSFLKADHARAPFFFELDTVLGLKTSKVKKKVNTIIKEMDDFLARSKERS